MQAHVILFELWQLIGNCDLLQQCLWEKERLSVCFFWQLCKHSIPWEETGIVAPRVQSLPPQSSTNTSTGFLKNNTFATNAPAFCNAVLWSKVPT